ncbi:MAG: efflux RND transporter periplasmic adaptor subunit [Acidobacteriota bacterium]
MPKKKMNPILALTAVIIVGGSLILTFSCKKKAEEQPLMEASAEHAGHAQMQPEAKQEPQKPEAKKEKKETIYHCPMHPNYTSDKPGNCPICGMTLVPVEEEQATPPPAKKKIMYRSSMNPNEISEKPGKDSMGMDMVPFEVEEGGEVSEVGGRVTVKISPERQQLIGVTFGQAEIRDLHHILRTVAKFTYDETKIVDVNTKFPGWVERLDVDFQGQLVRSGVPLFSIYSPELVAAQEEYLLASKAGGLLVSAESAPARPERDPLVEGAKRKLLLWDITETQIKELERTQTLMKTMVFYAPFTGYVIEKNVLKGKYVMPGETLYKLADISTIWVLADVYEYELPLVSRGQQVTVELPYFPGESFTGKITYIYPYLADMTRTAKVRVELPNRDFKLKPDMYGTISIHLDLGPKLSVPASAVLDSGTRKLVFIDRGEGYFEPREVKLGIRAGDFYEVIAGLQEGERVVTSANFLVDSESKLKAAIKAPTHKH